MYFTLEINEQLVNAMRAVAEAKAEFGIFLKAEEDSKLKSIDMQQLNDLDDSLCNVIAEIASIAGRVLAGNIVDESNNRVNENKQLIGG